MCHIGNIITESKIDITNFFNVTYDYGSVNKDLPTLIVGWEKVKSLFPEQNILNNKINDDLYWTFSKREKRYQYEKDLKSFTDNVINSLEDKIKYRFFNYLLSSEERRKDFINYIKKTNSSLYYNSRFLYVYVPADEITIGVSLKDLNYIRVDVDSFIKDISSEGNKIISNNVNDIGTDSFPIIKDNIKIFPYLNYLKNRDIY